MATPAFGKLEEESSNSGASEEVLDHIDGVFDGEYEELTGRAAADYIPLEKDEIFLKKGGVRILLQCSWCMFARTLCCHTVAVPMTTK